MILFTGGFPYSGKTQFLDVLSTTISNMVECIRLCPKDFYPKNFSDLKEQERKDWAISSWETCLEDASEALSEHEDDTLIILDTAAAKFGKMSPLFMLARASEHTIVYAFIHASLEDRKLRTKDDVEQFETYYAKSFKKSVPKLKELSDKFMLIKNPNDSEYINLNCSAKILSQFIEKTIFNASDD